MKSIQAQYTDLLEGKMSKANFMRNLRMTYPQHITPTLSYDDSIRVLKGKRMLSEAPEGVYGHNLNAEAPAKPGIDQLNYYQVYHGIQYELAQVPEITDEAYVKARKKVVDMILKDPYAYKDLQIGNYKAVKKIDKDLEMKDVKEDTKVDKANGMKVVRKDAPASANGSKREPKKKSNMQQMTQIPKNHKGVEVMDIPGKSTVLALKEHILGELTKPNETKEDFNVGSRIKKKGDDSKVGNIEEFDGDTALVKWDDGSKEHIQMNVITKRDLPKHTDASTAFSQLPNLDNVSQKGMSGMREVEEPQEDRKSKFKRLKERLIKALKREGFIAKTKNTGVTVTAGKNTQQGIQSAKDLERRTGEQLTVLDLKTGISKDA